MTTIAYDGKTLASDSLLSRNDQIVSLTQQKIFQCPPGKTWIADGEIAVAYGIAGNLAAQNALENALCGGKTPTQPAGFSHFTRFPKGLGFSYIIVLESGVSLLGGQRDDQEMPWYGRHTNPVTIGTGQEFAAGVMATGADAAEAVRLTSTLDVWTGGDVQQLKFNFA